MRIYYNSELELPSLNDNVIMNFMSITAPASAEEMVRNIYTYGDKEKVHRVIMKTLNPWPGSWDKVVAKGELD